jgi:hypothetical protein
MFTLADRLLGRFRADKPIVIVSGLPRSGTSMMMRMLEDGGIEPLTDGTRRADEDNPNGYYELEIVKTLDKGGETSWLANAQGKAVKVISFLLTWLPETYNYQVIFMERNLDEIIASQNKMLVHRDREDDVGGDDRTRIAYQRHLEHTKRFIAARRCFSTLTVNYNEVMQQPLPAAGRISEFLGRSMNVEAMVAAVDRGLYRNRLAPATVDRRP